MTKTLRFALAALIAVALASCGSVADETGEIAGEAIAAIPAPEGTEWRDMVTVTKLPKFPLQFVAPTGVSGDSRQLFNERQKLCVVSRRIL